MRIATMLVLKKDIAAFMWWMRDNNPMLVKAIVSSNAAAFGVLILPL